MSRDTLKVSRLSRLCGNIKKKFDDSNFRT